MKKVMTCIVCPMGCRLEAEVTGEEINGIGGNGCKRGEKYAISEIKSPVRVVTTTVELEGAYTGRLPVKTSIPVDKGSISDIMQALRPVKVGAPVKLGQVIVRNICGTGADILSAGDIAQAE